jgi:hypothetical protein
MIYVLLIKVKINNMKKHEMRIIEHNIYNGQDVEKIITKKCPYLKTYMYSGHGHHGKYFHPETKTETFQDCIGETCRSYDKVNINTHCKLLK